MSTTLANIFLLGRGRNIYLDTRTIVIIYPTIFCKIAITVFTQNYYSYAWQNFYELSGERPIGQ